MLDVVKTEHDTTCRGTVTLLRALTCRQFGENAIQEMRALFPDLKAVESCPTFTPYQDARKDYEQRPPQGEIEEHQLEYDGKSV